MTGRVLFLIASTFSLFVFMGCSSDKFTEDKVFLGKTVSKETLNQGHDIYMEYCMACHGEKGDGYGPAAKGSVPPPRNLQQGLYKFGLVNYGELLTDKDFLRIIKHGLNGTGMLKWDMTDEQINAVTQYIKTFAPQVWEDSESYEVGTPIETVPDPFKEGEKAKAVELGKKIYYVKANCQACHRGYISYPELNELNVADGLDPYEEVDPSFYQTKLQYSQYYYGYDPDLYVKYLPPDFTWHELRSINNVEDIYKRLVAGVNGAAMPAWRGVLSDKEMWATAYYVHSLMQLKGSEKRQELIQKIQRENTVFEASKQVSR